MSQLEADIQHDIKDALEKLGCIVIKNHPGVASCPRGWPDLSVYTPGGKHVLMEVKRPDEVLDPIQQHWHKTLGALHQNVCVVESEFEAVQFFRFLEQH